MTQTTSTTAPAPSAATDSRAAEIRTEQILTAARGTPVVLHAGIAAALLLAYGVAWRADQDERRVLGTIWFVLVAITLLIGAGIARKLARTPAASIVKVHRLGRWLSITSGISGLLWGSMPWWALERSSMEEETFVLAGIAMVMMGGSGSLAAYRPMVRAFALCLTAVFVGGVLGLHGEFYVLYAIAYGLLCFVTLKSSRNQEQALREQIKLRLEREEHTQAANAARANSEAARIKSDEARQASALALARLALERAAAESAKDASDKARDAAERAREKSEHARQEAELAQAKAENAQREAEAASRAKTQFIAAASHDMRGCLHAIGVYIDLLQKHNHDPQLAEYIKLGGLSKAALIGMLNSMLDMSKIESGTMRPALMRVAIKTIFDELEAEFVPTVTGRLKFNLVPARAVVYTDPLLLKRILGNLMSNALRYTERGRVLVHCDIRGERLRIRVSDSGIGIAEQEIEKIFEPFYQVTSDVAGTKGLGIGLTIVRDLCALLGYRLKVRSIPGRGSVFAVDVPIASAHHVAVSAPAPTTMDRVEGAKIMVIDNDPKDLGATAHLLRDLQCKPICVSSSSEAIAKLRKDRPLDLVLADYDLTGETGLEAIDRISTKLSEFYGPGYSLPVLIISGHISPSILRAVNDRGFPIVHKGVPSDELHRSLNQALGLSRNLPTS
jgi:signal transduction histidine kinase